MGRRRTSCDACRAHRRRCGGVEPDTDKCSNCAQLGVPCEWTSAGQPVVNRKKRARTTELEGAAAAAGARGELAPGQLVPSPPATRPESYQVSPIRMDRLRLGGDLSLPPMEPQWGLEETALELMDVPFLSPALLARARSLAFQPALAEPDAVAARCIMHFLYALGALGSMDPAVAPHAAGYMNAGCELLGRVFNEQSSLCPSALLMAHMAQCALGGAEAKCRELVGLAAIKLRDGTSEQAQVVRELDVMFRKDPRLVSVDDVADCKGSAVVRSSRLLTIIALKLGPAELSGAPHRADDLCRGLTLEQTRLLASELARVDAELRPGEGETVTARQVWTLAALAGLSLQLRDVPAAHAYTTQCIRTVTGAHPRMLMIKCVVHSLDALTTVWALVPESARPVAALQHMIRYVGEVAPLVNETRALAGGNEQATRSLSEWHERLPAISSGPAVASAADAVSPGSETALSPPSADGESPFAQLDEFMGDMPAMDELLELLRDD